MRGCLALAAVGGHGGRPSVGAPPPHHPLPEPAPRLDVSAISRTAFSVVAWLNDTLPSPAAATLAATARLSGALTDAAATATGSLRRRSPTALPPYPRRCGRPTWSPAVRLPSAPLWRA